MIECRVAVEINCTDPVILSIANVGKNAIEQVACVRDRFERDASLILQLDNQAHRIAPHRSRGWPGNVVTSSPEGLVMTV
jgi:hypothetical protein